MTPRGMQANNMRHLNSWQNNWQEWSRLMSLTFIREMKRTAIQQWIYAIVRDLALLFKDSDMNDSHCESCDDLCLELVWVAWPPEISAVFWQDISADWPRQRLVSDPATANFQYIQYKFDYVLLFLYMLIILSFHNVWIISLKSFHVCEIKNPQCTYTLQTYTYVILQTFR